MVIAPFQTTAGTTTARWFNFARGLGWKPQLLLEPWINIAEKITMQFSWENPQKKKKNDADFPVRYVSHCQRV